jgi:hypothetical protein
VGSSSANSSQLSCEAACCCKKRWKPSTMVWSWTLVGEVATFPSSAGGNINSPQSGHLIALPEDFSGEGINLPQLGFWQ